MQNRHLSSGKRVDNGEWIEGNLVQTNVSGELLSWILHDYRYLGDGQVDFERVRVIPETVSQCTGLKDKNGKLIFEGNMLQSENNSQWLVSWNDNMGSWWIRHLSENYAGALAQMMPHVKIIGNCWDKPELLEANQ